MSLVDELIRPLLEEEKKTVAVYGGGFKPPTAGHFEVVDQALKENPNIDEFIILIGGKERDGISPEESLIIWDIYKQYLPIKVEVKLSPKPPIQAVYNYAKEHPNEEVLFVIGAREGNEDDFSDISKRTKSLDKYDNLELRTIVTQGGASGTAARNAAKISTEKLKPLLPKQLKDEEVEEIFTILSNVVKENDPEDGKASPYGSGYKKLNENASYKEHIDIQDKIDRLTQHMIDKGMNIEPLPSLEFVDGDSENAKDFFGRTAYYDPNRQHIVLYTEGRHPKDIVRSYSHEMIHHIQNLEDRLGDIAGSDTTSDDHLDKLEQEANLRGTMTFRNWTDSLNEAKKNKDPFGINAYARELAMGLEEEFNLDKAPEKSVELKTYGDLKLALANIKKDQNLKKFKDIGGRAFSTAIGLIPGVSLASDVIGIFKAAFNKPDGVKTNTWLDKLDVDDDASKIVDDTVENEFIKVATEKFMKEPDDNALDPNFNMDDELNNHLKSKFNSRHVGGVNEQEKVDYKIYCDMDGVLADFESGYEKLTGVDLKGEFQKGDDFWKPISKAGVGFWAGLKWMPDGQKLWNYLKPYKPDLLSAPSREDSSRIGKHVWVKHKIPGTKLILRYAKQKQELATPESILIDDRQVNIDQWEAAGGIGILHTSADNTISQLKELGL